jgi:hypothetical protein
MFSNIFDDREASPLELPPNGTSLDLLRIVYRSTSIPLPVRLRAAISALPHEHPRLMVTAQVNEQSFAEILEKRLKRRIAEAKSNGRIIDGPKPEIEAKPPLPRISDRRYRRM